MTSHIEVANSFLSKYGRSTITWFLASGLVGSLITIAIPNDVFTQPALDIRAERKEGERLETSKITIENNGAGSATNLRVTINPQYNITKFQPTFYSEEISFEETGERSLIAKLPRLAPGARVVVSVSLNTTNSTPSFSIYANHDRGSLEGAIRTNAITLAEAKQIITIVQVVTWSMIAAIIGLSIYPFVHMWKRKKTYHSDPKKV